MLIEEILIVHFGRSMNGHPPHHSFVLQPLRLWCSESLALWSACGPHPQKSQPSCVVYQRVMTLRKNFAFFWLQVHISVWSDVFSYLSVSVATGSCSKAQEQEKADLCCGYDLGFGCDAAHDDFYVPFDNQRVCQPFSHQCHRKVIF